MIYKIRPTQHYLENHSDVDWEFVVRTVLSPDKTRLEKIQNRYTYVKRFKKYVIELHVEHNDKEMTIWIINAFKMER
ncbi:MAG: hypothetical protein V1870_03960 [Candidatus Aenigmatarchaeota archaeon]